MPEIKHTFTGGKMNKDLDERLVPNGEYRDARNIQIRTTPGDSAGEGDAGTAQNIEGNIEIGAAHRTYTFEGKTNTVVASIADEKNDRAYFFVAAPPRTLADMNASNILATNLDPVDTPTSNVLWVDSIVELSATTSGILPQTVVADVWAGTGLYVDNIFTSSYNALYQVNENNNGNGSFAFVIKHIDGIRPGMKIWVKDANNTLLTESPTRITRIDPLVIQEGQVGDQNNVGEIQVDENGDSYKVLHFDTIQPNAFYQDAAVIVFWMEPEDRVLNFPVDLPQAGNAYITGVNIIDDLLFWTDNSSEPKKINITRCKEGTANASSHTQLHVATSPSDQSLVPISDIENTVTSTLSDNITVNNDLKPHHITVLRQAPKLAPKLTMSNTDRQFTTTAYLSNYAFAGESFTPNVPIEGSIRDIELPYQCDFRIGDILIFSNDSSGVTLTAQVNSIINNNPQQIQVSLLSVDEDLNSSHLTWDVQLQQRDPLFELKLGRFAYRYKYEDGEYSTISPWSELAFLPGSFKYTPSKGYNDGMVNNVRQLTISGFIPNNLIRPLDVKAVDVLYKTTDDSNIYIVKTINREQDREWENFDQDNPGNNEGSITLTSEMIHKVLPSDQTLRAWDNVPRKALAQEIVGNRLVYGNYTQGYDIGGAVGLEQISTSSTITQGTPIKSVKSLRSYKFGMVFGDKYGRETPVITGGLSSFLDGNTTTTTGDVTIDKDKCNKSNKFTVTQNWDNEPESWFDYVKYYVKETSNEYYNLVMDRWYDAEDGNIWLSFPSVDRNKVDEETYLILKNEHGTQNAVLEKARYKIIAIESEAPEYIKINARGMGKIPMNNIDVYSGGTSSTGIPDLLIGKSMIRMDPAWWQDPFNGGMLSKDDFQGRKMVRVVGHVGENTGDVQYSHETSWVRVSRIVYNSANQPNGVVIAETLGNEVNMYSHFQSLGLFTTVASTYDGSGNDLFYSLEFKDEVPENLPEFDGRFFVKIEKDDVLKNRVLKSTINGFEEIDSYTISYIEPAEQNPANPTNPGEFANYEWAGVGFSSSSVLTGFGDTSSDNAESTEAFWSSWYNSNGNRLFLDGARGRGINYKPPGNADALNNYDDNGLANDAAMLKTISASGVEGDHEWGGNLNVPMALGSGGDNYTGNTLGTMTVSQIGRMTDNNNNFKNAFQDINTYFRFSNDPNPNVYKVVSDSFQFYGEYIVSTSGEEDDFDPIIDTYESTQSTTDLYIDPDQGDIAYQQSGLPSSSFNGANYNPAPDIVDRRSSIVIRFQKVSEDGTPLTDANGLRVGLNPTVWDPRGELKHDGSNNIQLVVLQPVEDTSLSTDSFTTDSACWETEPKKDVGLDIYHEASSAIPIRLNNNNIIPFTSPALKTSKAARVSIEDWDSTVDYGSPFVNDAHDQYVQIYHTQDGSAVPMLENIPIGSVINFTHHDGTVTSSTILEFSRLSYFPTSDSFGFGVSGGTTSNNVPNFYQQTPSEFEALFVSAAGFLGGYQFVYFSPDAGDIIEGAELIANPNTPNEVSLGTINLIGQFSTNAVILFSVTGDVSSLTPLAYGGQAASTYSMMSLTSTGSSTGWYKIDTEVWKYPVKLGWHNCWAFGNGVESDRIRDDFNAPQLDNGVKASTTFLDYGEEKIGSGLIYSGLYNSKSKVNSLNQFNMAEKITKDLNPIYGSIQALKTRDTDVVVFTEDKVLKVLANKDAVFNADGNPQLTATDKVLGQTVPFAGDYGISKNPESLAGDQYRLYFADKQRGAILRLSRDGLTPISNIGMKTWFRKYLDNTLGILGTFDSVNGEYNITLDYRPGFGQADLGDTTVSFNEGGKGWVSFKSFIPKAGCSVSGKYWTANKSNKIWQHYNDTSYNTFYGASAAESRINILFNDSPSSIKSFKTVNYEGSQSKILESGNLTSTTTTDVQGNTVPTNDGDYYNLISKKGWYVEDFKTDQHQGTVPEFINKEGKWFNKINGKEISITQDINPEKLPVQGLGFPTAVTPFVQSNYTITIQDSSDDDV